MTTPDLDAIRARAGRVERWLDTEPGGLGRNEARELVEDDLATLLAEVVRLRAELDPDSHRDTEPWAQRLFEQRDEAIAEADRLRAELVETCRRVGRLHEHILDIAMHATPYGDIPDEPGWVGTYLLTAGALHRALGTIGHTAPSCQAEAELTRIRPVAEKAKAWRTCFGADALYDLDVSMDDYKSLERALIAAVDAAYPDGVS